MNKIGIIVQRYGLEVNGGAEYHARVLAEKLNLKYEVEVLTTRAIDHDSWANHYSQTDHFINSVRVLRFDTLPKNHKKFRSLRRKILTSKKTFLHHILIRFKLKKKGISELDCKNFIKHQGPYCPDLIKYINTNKDQYHCFIFFTYLYYPTLEGMKNVGYKSIFIPTAHDEPLIYTKPYESIFYMPKYIMYNTLSEKKLVENIFPNITAKNDVAGIGIDFFKLPDDSKPYFDFDYFLYIGRIDYGKGCDEMIRFFNAFYKSNKNIKLVLTGKNYLDINSSDQIIFTGFVDESTKYNLLKHCKALIIPSKYESLSLVTLEAFLHHKIVIANEHCQVIKNHIHDSQAGFTYVDQDSFIKCLENVIQISPEQKIKMTLSGQKYVSEKYAWDSVLQKFDTAIQSI